MARQTTPPADAGEPDDDEIDEVAAPPATADIYERLSWAQSQVRRVEKRGRNADQKYDYAKAEDVYAMVRPILARSGIAYLVAMNGAPQLEPTGQETSRGLAYMRWWIDVTIMLRSPEVPTPPRADPDADPDAIGDGVDGGKANEIRIAWRCVADDYSDKGAAKAMTLGLKSWIMATFMVSSGSDDAEETDRQAGTTQPAGTRTPAGRGGPGDEQPRMTPLASKQKQAYAASRNVEGEFGPDKTIEITRYITGAEKISEITDVEVLARLIRALDRYRTAADEREGLDERMAAHLRAAQDAAAEGPVAQEPREEHGAYTGQPEDEAAADPGPDAGDAPNEPPFDPATEQPPPVVDPPAVGEQSSLGDES